jgi:proteasome accessory factor B/proteasome accessory factor C
MKNLGYWYLTGFCELRNDLRTFKFERILEVHLLPETFSPPIDFEVGKYKNDFLKSMGTHEVEIHFDKELSPWIREQWGSSVREADDGGMILTLSTETLEFPSRLVLGSAPHARPLSPPEFIEKVRQDASEIVASRTNALNLAG